MLVHARQAKGCGMRRDLSLSEYIAWWRGRQGGGCDRKPAAADTADAVGGAAMASAESSGRDAKGSGEYAGSCGSPIAEPLLYLKDWHFASEHPHYQVMVLLSWRAAGSSKRRPRSARSAPKSRCKTA